MSDDLVQVGDVWLDLDPRGPERKVLVTEFKWPFAFVVSSTSRRHTRIHQATLVEKFRLESRLPASLRAAP
jgi:hypothetical protein